MDFVNAEFMILVSVGLLAGILWEIDTIRHDISEFIQHMYEWEDEFEENMEDKR